ncbi:MAG: sigma-70 family RNA polymerase sigma factor [Armatimonadetes bacterium]|nr:sigma-70 family RNA polymerase sigma factor [Armatimonadota bacterium]
MTRWLRPLIARYYNRAAALARRRHCRPNGSAAAALTLPSPKVDAGRSGVGAMPFDVSDRALVARWKRGDATAFSTLHRRYYARIYRFAYMRTGSVEDASDIASETFCRALHKIGGYEFRRSDSLYPWLHQIASNLVIDLNRARPAGGILSLDARAAEEVDAFLEHLADDGPTPQDLAERAEMRDLVLRAIERLPTDQARAITYRFLGDLSIREIAREMSRSCGAVKSLLHRALLGLRSQIRDAAAPTASGQRGATSTRAEANVRETIQIQRGSAP